MKQKEIKSLWFSSSFIPFSFVFTLVLSLFCSVTAGMNGCILSCLVLIQVRFNAKIQQQNTTLSWLDLLGSFFLFLLLLPLFVSWFKSGTDFEERDVTLILIQETDSILILLFFVSSSSAHDLDLDLYLLSVYLLYPQALYSLSCADIE